MFPITKMMIVEHKYYFIDCQNVKFLWSKTWLFAIRKKCLKICGQDPCLPGVNLVIKKKAVYNIYVMLVLSI